MWRWALIWTMVAAVNTGPALAKPASVDAYMKQPRKTPDAVVHYGPAAAQVAQLFLPKSPEKGGGPHPVIVLLHGGCFLKQFEGLEQMTGVAAELAERGYAVWNLDYRKLGEAGAGYPGTFQDVAIGIDALRAEAPKHGLDLTRVIAVGHSAGGHLALWAASRARIPPQSVLATAQPLPIRAVISLAGIGDLKGQGTVFGIACGADTLDLLIDSAHRPAPYADTSPAEMLPLSAKVVMVHGVYDRVMPPYTGLDFAKAVRAKGGRAEVVTVAGAGHFDVVIPTTAAWSEVRGIIDREMAGLAH